MNHPDYRHIAQGIRNATEWDDSRPLTFAAEGVDIFNLAFRSSTASHLLGQSAYRCDVHGKDFAAEPASDGTADCEIKDNLEFRYPMLRPHAPAGDQTRSRHLVILLHGLNERSYSKYLPWAYQLCRSLNAAVAMFPLSFHVNRVESNWGRQIKQHEARRQAVPRNENAHGFNSVLSERLDMHPERFFWGGLQSYGDVVQLVAQIRAGQHQYVDPSAHIDLLGYSAGGYLSLGLMLADHAGLFKDSRAVLFGAGAVLKSTHLSTRFIMDMACEISLMKLYVRFTQRLATPRLAHWLGDHEEGRWFRALFGEEGERLALEQRLKEIAPRVIAIANSNDEVIPAHAVLNTMQGLHRDTGVRVETLKLGVHEHPFVCPDYLQRDRRFVTEFLDVPVFGKGFEQFIDAAVGLMKR